jgi:hypothetical protein
MKHLLLTAASAQLQYIKNDILSLEATLGDDRVDSWSNSVKDYS